MKFKPGEHYRQRATISSSRGRVDIELTHWEVTAEAVPYRDVSNDPVASIITMDIGAAHVHADITPAEARALAIILQKHADDVEEHQRQMDEVAA